MRRILSCVLLATSLGSVTASANPTREFIMSCTYGVMAGTLVGTATLAFTPKPGDNLNKVARGASLGLYTGILLGLYVVYVVPNMEPEEELDPLVGRREPPFEVMPILNTKNDLDGIQAQVTVHRF